jgi:hypothetical protein
VNKKKQKNFSFMGLGAEFRTGPTRTKFFGLFLKKNRFLTALDLRSQPPQGAVRIAMQRKFFQPILGPWQGNAQA